MPACAYAYRYLVIVRQAMKLNEPQYGAVVLDLNVNEL
jgi:hypothetical protein